MKSKTPIIIVFDGLIGSGKTTLIKSLCDYMNSKGIKTMSIFEPVDLWKECGALEHFYKDIPQNCYEFQTFVYVTRIKDLLKKYNEYKDEIDIFLVERSILTDRYVFVEMLKNDLGSIRYNMYREWADMWKQILPFNFDLFVFLDTSVKTSLERINKRNRAEEKGIQESYQQNLQKAHNEFYHNYLKQLDYNTITINNEIMDSDIKDITENVYKNIKDTLDLKIRL